MSGNRCIAARLSSVPPTHRFSANFRSGKLAGKRSGESAVVHQSPAELWVCVLCVKRPLFVNWLSTPECSLRMTTERDLLHSGC